MLKIRTKLRQKLASNEWYKKCCRCGSRPVQWHHTTILGKQLDEEWAIVPACITCHKAVDIDRKVKKYFEWIAVIRMTAEDKLNHSKWDWKQIKESLDKEFLKYGNQSAA